MLIGELAQKTGFSRDTIRFYEKTGLILAPCRREGSGYKEYDEATIERLYLIRQAKILGFTLSEIQQSLSAWQNGELSKSKKTKLLQDKIEQIDEKVQQLKNMRIYLLDKLEKINRA